MNRTKHTIANALTQIVSVFFQSISVLFVTKFIIVYIGSDYNGLASTATQFLTLLTLLEGGFTVASLVKLYKPYGENDIETLNKYLSLSQKKFRKIGYAYFFVGIGLSFIYTPLINTNATYWESNIIIIMTVVSSAYSIFFISKIRLMYQVSQKEYRIYLIQTLVNCLMYGCEILVIIYTQNIIYVRACVMIFQFFLGVIIKIDSIFQFPSIQYTVDCKDVEISGTKEIFISKICGLIYLSSPVLFISTFTNTALTSVYSVYSSIMAVVVNTLNALIISPRNAIGQLVHEKTNNKLCEIFNVYEYTSTLVLTIFSSTTFAMVMPFISIYTLNIHDINYNDSILAILLVLNTIFQMIHIPSGTLIEVSGYFTVIKKIQGVAVLILISVSIVGALLNGIYGILVAKLVTSIYLCIAEITFTRRKILATGLSIFFKNNMTNIVMCLIIGIVEFFVFRNVKFNVATFVMVGFVILISNILIVLGINYFTERKYLSIVFQKVGNRYFQKIQLKFK